MDNKSNFRRGSIELLILHLLKQKDYYGYELTQIMKNQTDGVMNIPVGSLYPALYKLIDNGYISDYKKQAGKRLIRVYYHLEDAGRERLKILLNDYYQTSQAIQKILNYTGEENRNEQG
jgi:hypothetical protein